MRIMKTAVLDGITQAFWTQYVASADNMQELLSIVEESVEKIHGFYDVDDEPMIELEDLAGALGDWLPDMPPPSATKTDVRRHLNLLHVDWFSDFKEDLDEGAEVVDDSDLLLEETIANWGEVLNYGAWEGGQEERPRGTEKAIRKMTVRYIRDYLELH